MSPKKDVPACHSRIHQTKECLLLKVTKIPEQNQNRQRWSCIRACPDTWHWGSKELVGYIMQTNAIAVNVKQQS